MALDQILNLTQSDILEIGKACDAEDDEEDIAEKFSEIEQRIVLPAADIIDSSSEPADINSFSDHDTVVQQRNKT